MTTRLRPAVFAARSASSALARISSKVAADMESLTPKLTVKAGRGRW